MRKAFDMFVTCPNLSFSSRIKHGFFTRNHGVSAGIYNSLNCGYGSGDEMTKVSENRRRVASEMGGATLCTVHQVHSPRAVIVDEPWEHKDAPEADALVTARPGIALGILTADCLPILFADGKNGVIAAAHSGWKGAIGGVIENTITAMQGLGAALPDISATIGPAISQKSYEVGAEFFERFIGQDTDNENFFLQSDRENHYLFDLAAYASHRLDRAGISQINIIAQDTYLNDNSFFSYRRSCKRGEPAYGRQISVITLLPS
jgi:YfiH family protein